MQIEQSSMTRDYSAAVRYRTIGMFEYGMALANLWIQMDVPQATIYFWIRKFKMSRDVERGEGSWRPSVTSKRTDCLVRLAKSNRFASSSALLNLSGESISPTIVRRRLRAIGYSSRRPKVHSLLPPVHRQTRLTCAMKRCHSR